MKANEAPEKLYLSDFTDTTESQKKIKNCYLKTYV